MIPKLKAIHVGISIFLVSCAVLGKSAGQTPPATDRRVNEIRHLDMTYSLPEYRSREEWLLRAANLRKQIMVSAGLWPMPERQPIKAVIFDKLDRGDFTVEKVYFESYPGFYVTGNLYRPKNLAGKLPAVLCPHGHWAYGRLENTPVNSGPARAIGFARQGYVAFSYDMIGYNDSSTITHKFANHNVTGREALWSVNLLGLQLWNSIRAIDFLLTLPEVDPERIACTGESGGGTQTFLLMAVDERIKVASPVNMVSFLMQGGSLCENAPNLRIDTNNVEIAALMAPRPMIMISATGDWTKNTLKDEYPAIRNIYRLFDAEDKITAVQIDAPHNYNQQSREAVYGWFAHWLLNRPEVTPIKEKSAGIPSIPELLVFFSRQRPQNELNEAQLTQSLIEQKKKQFEDALAHTESGLQKFTEHYGEALRLSLMAEYPKSDSVISTSIEETKSNDSSTSRIILSRRGHDDRVAISIQQNSKSPVGSVVLVLSAADSMSDAEAQQAKRGRDDLINLLLQSGHMVATINNFPQVQGTEKAGKYRYFTTYNRTDVANQIQDVLTAISYLNHQVRTRLQGSGVKTNLNVIALDRAGAWALLARGFSPQIDKLVVDAAKFDNTSDEDYLKYLPVPGIRRAGDFETAVTIAPLTPLLIHNTGNKFRTDKLSEIFRRFGRAENFKTQSTLIDHKKLLDWLSSN